MARKKNGAAKKQTAEKKTCLLYTSLGFDYVEDKLLNGALDKEAVMQKTVIGGATC